VAPRGNIPAPSRLLASPKRRAKETLTPLSHALHLPLEIDGRLDERHQTETGGEFQDRIVSVFSDLEAQASDEGCVYLCTHLDWLEGAMIALNHDMSELEASLGWSTAEYKIFKLEDGIWKSKAKGHVT
jgi:broad specificity phosphatase PhoE